METEQAVLENFGKITDSIVSLYTIPGVRQKYLKVLNSDLNMMFLKQFVVLSSLTNRELINQILSTAQAYHESHIEDRIGAFQEVEDVLAPFLDDAGRYPSIFTKHCIIAPLEKIYEYIRKDFASNEATKPTSVRISPLDRKYPPSHER